MPMTAGRSGPPVRASGISATTVPAGSGARMPVTSKAYPLSRTRSQTPRARSSRRALPCRVIPEPRAPTSGLISTRSTATPREARWTAEAIPARPPPITRTLFTAGMAEDPSSLDGDGVDRRADGSGDGQRGGGEEEIPDPVGGAVGREGVEIPHLANEQADVWDDDLVQRLERLVELIGSHLEAPRIRGDAGDLGVVQPVRGGERQARRG